MRNVSFISDNVVQERAHENLQKQGQSDSDQRNLFEIVKSLEKQVRDFRGMGRTQYWHEAWLVIKDYPVLGIGLNTYSRITEERKITKGGYAHNCYLQMASETGVLGLLAFLGIIFTLYYRSCKKIHQIEDRFLYAVLMGALAGLTGFLVHIFFDTTYYSVQLGNFLWVILGIIVAAQRVEVKN